MRGLDRIDRLALLLVLAGVTVLYTASVLATPAERQIADMDEGDVGAMVRVTGTAIDYTTADGVEFFRINGDTGELRAVHFDGSLPIANGERYAIEGRIKLYQGELELVVEDVVNLSSNDNQG